MIKKCEIFLVSGLKLRKYSTWRNLGYSVIDICVKIHWLVPAKLIKIIRDSADSEIFQLVLHNILHFNKAM